MDKHLKPLVWVVVFVTTCNAPQPTHLPAFFAKKAMTLYNLSAPTRLPSKLNLSKSIRRLIANSHPELGAVMGKTLLLIPGAHHPGLALPALGLCFILLLRFIKLHFEEALSSKGPLPKPAEEKQPKPVAPPTPIASPPSASDKALLKRLQDHMQNHLDDRTFDVKSMAALASKSRAAFHPWFKSVTGTTPAKYLAMLRIERADHLLATTDDTMEAIALKTGFNDGAYLANKYKRYYGICPSEARKRHLKRNLQEN